MVWWFLKFTYSSSTHCLVKKSCYNRIFTTLHRTCDLAVEACQFTFQVWGARGRNGRGWGLAEALKGSLLSGGVVWSPVLLFLLLLVWTHGLQSQLFPVHKYPGYYRRRSQLPGQKQYQQHDEWCGSWFDTWDNGAPNFRTGSHDLCCR